MDMPGKRKANPLNLEPRVYMKHGAFYYVHKGSQKWERLGTDAAKANERARIYNGTAGQYGTVAYWLDMFLAECDARVATGDLSARTRDDYRENVVNLKLFFAPPMIPAEIEPRHVQEYLHLMAKAGRAVRANRERACLSACLSWLLRTGNAPGLTANPCFRQAGIKRNPEGKRERYVTNEEYLVVFRAAPASVRALMELTYRTLQRPESDILGWTVKNLHTKDGQRVLRVDQNKTGQTVDIALAPELEGLINDLIGIVPSLCRPLIHTKAGKPYTYSGLNSMLHKTINRVNKERAAHGKPKIEPFGFRDLKGKGATDMWLAGEPIERIQLLCGHDKASTTEIYVKQRWRETARPNRIKVAV
jgi:integrase